ncbi:MAG: hypothetical protein ACK6BN_10320 [Pseudanabaena sp.]|jgi:hypothetical protein
MNPKNRVLAWSLDSKRLSVVFYRLVAITKYILTHIPLVMEA